VPRAQRKERGVFTIKEGCFLILVASTASRPRLLRLRLRLLRLRLVTSRGPSYPSRSPRAHPSGWTRTQGLSYLLVSYMTLASAAARVYDLWQPWSAHFCV